MALSRSAAVSAMTVLACVTLAACRPGAGERETGNASGNESARAAPLPVAEPPLDRRRLLVAVASAASAHSAGIDDSGEQTRLDGKLFELRIRFGCGAGAEAERDGAAGGGAQSDQALSWALGKDDRTLRLRARPDLTLNDALVRELGGEAVEAAEGFWLRRPWLLTDACPVAPSAPEPARGAEDAEPSAERTGPAAPSQRIGIAQFFGPGDSRTRQRMGRAYESVKRIEPGRPVGAQGFNLVLSGRLRTLPGKRVITCRALDANTAPSCVISADIDQVRIESPGDGEVLAQWGDS